MKLYEINEPSPNIKCSYLSDEGKRFVAEHCKPWLQAVDYDLDQYPIYRGMRPVSATYQVPNIPDLFVKPGHYDERRPADTPYQFHDILNKKFKGKFGIPFRNGVFAIGSPKHANDYGPVYRIIPMGNFKFCWSPKINDLYLNLFDVKRNKKEALFGPNVHLTSDMSNHSQKELSDMCDTIVATYTDKNIKQAINSYHEIMLWCDNYLIVEHESPATNPVKFGGLFIGHGSTGIVLADSEVEHILLPGDAEQYCKSLNYNGYSDWELPTGEELKTVIKHLRSHNADDPYKLTLGSQASNGYVSFTKSKESLLIRYAHYSVFPKEGMKYRVRPIRRISNS